MNPFKNRYLVIGVLALLILAVAGFFYVQSAPAEDAAAPALQTAKVRKGDLTITASGAGTVLPYAQADLGFRVGGIVADVSVPNGAQVSQADVLARLEDNLQAEADFRALFSTQGLAQAELAVANAQAALTDSVGSVAYLYGDDAWYWETRIFAETEALQALSADATQAQKDEIQKKLDDARSRRDYFLQININTNDIPQEDLALALSNYESAKLALQDAQAALAIVQTGEDALAAPIVSIGAETARLEQARLALENTRLVAPFDGAVVALNVAAGQTVGSTPVMTIASTDNLLARFYLDETDVSRVAAGNPVNFVFDAYPDDVVVGEVSLVEPALQVVDGTPVVVVWATLPNESPFEILSGMSVEAEVISAQSKDALLIPAQALRELTPGSYAVFLVSPDGELKMTPVTIGLRDFANVEILSGLQVGDAVSTGTVETK